MSFWSISESQARNIDTYCKALGTVAILAAGIWTLVTYFNAREKEIQNATLEAQKPFLSKRLDIYSDVLRVAYKIDDASQAIVLEGKTIRQSALIKQQEDNQRELWRMLGLINLVSDAHVLGEIQKFLDCFDEFKGRTRGPKCNTGALSLAKAIRESVSSEWQIYLPPETIAKGKEPEKVAEQEREKVRRLETPPLASK
jgi:hypothetical protein